MVEMEKTREQLAEELAQARKRIADLEMARNDEFRTLPVGYDTFRAFFDSATDSFSIWDSNMNMVYINDVTLGKYYPAGTTRADIIGRHFTELIPGCVESGRYERYLNVLKTGEPVYIDEFQPHTRFGDMYLSIKVFKIEKGLGIITTDITKQKRMEQELRAGQQRLSALIENAPDIIFSYDFNGVFTYGNNKVGDLLGYDADELVGKNIAESGLLSKEGLLTAMAKLEDNRRGITTGPDEYDLTAKNGSHIFIEARGVPIVIGDRSEVLCVAHDVTDRRKTEEALRHSEEELRAIFESIGDSITVIDTKGNITDLNDAAVKLFGCNSKEEALGINSLTFIVEEDQPSAADKLNQAKPERFVQYKFKRKDGSVFQGETSSDVLHDRSGNITGFIGIVRDITERKKTEESLRHSEEKFRVIFSSIADGISVIDLTTGKIIDTNEAALRMFNFTREDVIGMNAYELIAEKDRQRAMEDLVNTLQTGDSGLAEWCLLGKGGTEHDCEARASVIRDSSWNPLYLVNVMRDITERKKIEEKLRQSEEKLRRVLDSMEDGVSVTDIEGTVLDVNEKALELSGYSRDEFIGKFGLELLVERDRDRAIQDMLNTLNTGRSGLKEYFSLTKDGREFPAEARSTVLYDSAGKPIGLVSVLRDITERKQMDDKLKQSEEKIRQIFNSIGVGITVTDAEGKVIEINDFGLNLCGYGKEEMLGHNGIKMIADRDRRRIIKAMIEAFETGQSKIQEFAAIKKNGAEYDVEAVATVTRNAEGKTSGLIISITEVTERKRIEKELNDYKLNLEKMVQERTTELAKTNKELLKSEESLRNSEQKLRTMFTSMADGVVVTDLEGYFKDANMAAVRMFGYRSKEDVRDANGFEFIADRDRETAMKDMAQLFAEGLVTGRSWTFKHSSGSEFKAELSTALLKDANGNPIEILVVMRDITERKRMEEALIVSEEKLRATFEAIADGIAVVDLNGKLTDVNTADVKLFGYEGKGDLTNLDALSFVSESDRDRAINDMASVAITGLGVSGEYKLVDRYGREFDAEVRGSALRNTGGETTAIVNVIRDITERKQWEEKLKKSREELRFYLNQITKAQEEERKRVARELHDDTIQDLITLSRQLDDLVDKRISPSEDRRRSREKIEQAQQKVAAILQSVRNFTRELRPSILDDLGLGPALEWLASDMSGRFGIPINMSITGSERSLDPDTALAMFRIAQESLTNAGRHAKASQIQVNLKFTKKTASLSIIDNGVGFTPPKQISKLTKLGKLGIAGMYERAQLIGAGLSVKSNRKKGTSISLEVPIK